MKTGFLACLRKKEKVGVPLSIRFPRITQQLLFLKECRDGNVLPPTIEQIRFPSFMRAKSMEKTATRIKKTILQKMIRFLQQQLHYAKRDCHKAVSTILTENKNGESFRLTAACEKAYQRSKTHHQKRLFKKTSHIMKAHANPNETPEDKSEVESRHALVTDRSGSLNPTEIQLLAKGPKFAITRKWTDDLKIDIQANFCKIAYQLRWRSQTGQKDQDEDRVTRYPESSILHLPQKEDQQLEHKLRQSYAELKKLIDNIEGQRQPRNMTKMEIKTLQNLRKKDLVFLPSDKGGEFCIVSTNDYEDAALRHLGDENTYRKTARMTAKTIETKINGTWRRISASEQLKPHIIRSYVSSNTDLPRFYHLVKTHKEGPEMKIRPIVSNCNGPTKKISWLLCNVLNPLYQLLPTHLDSSMQLINAIRNLDTTVTATHSYPFSLDVCALYTSIPPQAAVQAIRTKLLQHREKNWPLQVDHICELLEVILQNNYFSFQNAVYKQVSGLPMGNNVSGILSSVYMDAIEQQTLHQLNIGLFKRYVDDVFILTTDEEEAKNIYRHMNKQNKNIKFEIELPKDKSLSLLDFKVSMESGTPTFSFFRKQARKPVFINYKSAMPEQAKLSCIRNEMNRIEERCSIQEEGQYHLNKFKETLRMNGYPEHIIRNSRTKVAAPKHQKARDFVYLKFPFLNDRVQRQVQNIFRRNDLPVRVFDKNATLRNSLQRRTQPDQCQLRNCSISDGHICHIKRCVYTMRCKVCNAIYIGSTLRALHIRVREHLTQERSSVFDHKRQCRGDFDVTITAKARDNTSLRFKEALLIKRLQPAINQKRESEELTSLTFS
jgi:hypothetical protein